MITMVHSNPARLTGGILCVDRKFHTGMLAYCAALGGGLTTVHPLATRDHIGIDMIEVSLDCLPYAVLVVEPDGDLGPFRILIESSTLAYGMGLGFERIAQACGVPYVMVAEYDLKTRIVVSTSQVRSVARKSVRAARIAWDYFMHFVPDARLAASIHCNGYPICDALQRVNPKRLLYLDSRMSESMVVSSEQLRGRLLNLRSRPLRLIFSGRYEPLKGALDVVKVGISAIRRGLRVEMHTYGDGSQKGEMRRLVESAGMTAQITVHDGIAYPELVEISCGFDVFVCCHIQGDPSCTYLESFGAGLPIVGYDNRMWRRLCQESGAGLSVRMHDVEAVVGGLESIQSQSGLLEELSSRAREFALSHTFDREFVKRTDAIREALASARAVSR
jgi:colanic acid/amylovoran biosynthesis glycosyltransferase